MKAKRDILSISYVKSHTAEVISQVNETKNPVYVTQNGNAKAVLIDTESYEAIRDASLMMKILSFGEKDIKEGRFTEHDEVFKEIESKFFKSE